MAKDEVIVACPLVIAVKARKQTQKNMFAWYNDTAEISQKKRR